MTSRSYKNFKPSNDPELSMLTKKTLVLDLDQTLIYSKDYPFKGADARPSFTTGGLEFKVYISKRPGLEEFLVTMSKHYTLVIFTTSIRQYVNAVLRTLNIQRYFTKVFNREYCVRNKDKEWVKDLSIVGESLTDIVLVDDCPVHLVSQPSNLVSIKGYNGESEDQELLKLSEFLIELSQSQDVRPVIKKFVNARGEGSIEECKRERSQPLRSMIQRQIITEFKKEQSYVKSVSFKFDIKSTICDLEEDSSIGSSENNNAQELPKMNSLKKPIFALSNTKTRMEKLAETFAVVYKKDPFHLNA